MFRKAGVEEKVNLQRDDNKAQEAALANAKDAMQLWVDTARAFGDPVPESKRRRLMYA